VPRIPGFEIPVDLTFPFGDGTNGLSFPGFLPFASESAGSVDDLVQVTHEARLAYDAGGKFSGQAGLFYFDEDVRALACSLQVPTM